MGGWQATHDVINNHHHHAGGVYSMPPPPDGWLLLVPAPFHFPSFMSNCAWLGVVVRGGGIWFGLANLSKGPFQPGFIYNFC